MWQTTKTITLSLLLLAAFSCEDHSTTLTNSSNQEQVKIEDGILIFDDEDHFEETLSKVIQMDSEERIAWESNLGFKSKRTAIEKALEQVKIDSSLAYQFEGLIRLEEEFNAYVPAFPFMQRASLLSVDGIIGIDSLVRIYKNDRVITISEGGLERLSEAHRLQENSEDKSITVAPILSGRLQSKGNNKGARVRPYRQLCYVQNEQFYLNTLLRFSWVDLGEFKLGPILLRNIEYELTFEALHILWAGGQRPFPVDMSVDLNIDYSIPNAFGGKNRGRMITVNTNDWIVSEPLNVRGPTGHSTVRDFTIIVNDLTFNVSAATGLSCNESNLSFSLPRDLTRI